MLGNDSAQIREDALNDLIERSENVELWQAPLVTRKFLPDGAAERMAGFLAENLLDALRERADLDSSTLDTVGEIVIGGRLGGKEALSPGFDFLKVEPPIAAAERLMSAGKLADDVVFKALQAGDHAFVFAAIIVRAGVDLTLARKIFIEKSPQGIVALIGKAGLPSNMVVNIQEKMGRIAPSEVILVNEKNDFPHGCR